jgi:hypothetical protein
MEQLREWELGVSPEQGGQLVEQGRQEHRAQGERWGEWVCSTGKYIARWRERLGDHLELSEGAAVARSSSVSR